MSRPHRRPPLLPGPPAHETRQRARDFRAPDSPPPRRTPPLPPHRACRRGAGDLKLTADPDSGCFDAGFETGDAPLDRAVRVLRMLFVKDLRDLQTSIDETIVAAQEFTANPKTDTRQGKVGR